MRDTPDTPDGETFDQMMARLGAEKDTSSGSTITFLGPKGTAASKKRFERREPPQDEPAA